MLKKLKYYAIGHCYIFIILFTIQDIIFRPLLITHYFIYLFIIGNTMLFLISIIKQPTISLNRNNIICGCLMSSGYLLSSICNTNNNLTFIASSVLFYSIPIFYQILQPSNIDYFPLINFIILIILNYKHFLNINITSIVCFLISCCCFATSDIYIFQQIDKNSMDRNQIYSNISAISLVNMIIYISYAMIRNYNHIIPDIKYLYHHHSLRIITYIALFIITQLNYFFSYSYLNPSLLFPITNINIALLLIYNRQYAVATVIILSLTIYTITTIKQIHDNKI